MERGVVVEYLANLPKPQFHSLVSEAVALRDARDISSRHSCTANDAKRPSTSWKVRAQEFLKKQKHSVLPPATLAAHSARPQSGTSLQVGMGASDAASARAVRPGRRGTQPASPLLDNAGITNRQPLRGDDEDVRGHQPSALQTGSLDDNNTEFVESWAHEILIGKKTREFIGIHVAKENESLRAIAKQHKLDPKHLLELNADWYPKLTASSKLKASTKLMYPTDDQRLNRSSGNQGQGHTVTRGRAIEGIVLGPVDPAGISSPFWRVQYPVEIVPTWNSDSVNSCGTEVTIVAEESKQDDEASVGSVCVFERSIEEVWAACWAWEAHDEGWILSGNEHIGAVVAKATRAVAAGRRIQGVQPGHQQRFVMGRVVGWGGNGEENVDENGDEVWRVHYQDYDYEDLNWVQLREAMRNANRTGMASVQQNMALSDSVELTPMSKQLQDSTEQDALIRTRENAWDAKADAGIKFEAEAPSPAGCPAMFAYQCYPPLHTQMY